MCFRFIWLHVATEADVRNIFSSVDRDLVVWNEEEVLVDFTLPPTPCASLPNSFAEDVFHIVLCLGSRKSCL